MKKQCGFIGPDFGKMIVVLLIVAALSGYGVIRGVEWLFTNFTVQVKSK